MQQQLQLHPMEYLGLSTKPHSSVPSISSNDIQNQHFLYFLYFIYIFTYVFYFFYNFDENRFSMVRINIYKMLTWQGLEKTCIGIYFSDQIWMINVHLMNDKFPRDGIWPFFIQCLVLNGSWYVAKLLVNNNFLTGPEGPVLKAHLLSLTHPTCMITSFLYILFQNMYNLPFAHP
jgi:hypothetical protein